ncbi:GAF domain-containing protein [Streptomyces kanamyceticus]|uniref:GAF domain-containing protein n=1 Tax=Streptomyces kanamyceticus TaxID=1967 RepID=A0A5J6G5Y9_STRKN|nr:GAF domain-containing protein [Streptomyces kanamyceticus]QEU90373.1 GAF domain-containing protein [Streptomyces kanamyceticus]
MKDTGPDTGHGGAAEDDHRRLLRSVVRTAVAIFDARASSIALLDQADGELVFEAVAGKGEDALVGRRFPAERGIAGWVLQSRQPVEVQDVDRDAHFARDIAESTDYVPKALMAAPLFAGDEPLGVLEVLDRSQELRAPLAAMELLALFADQASVALALVQRGRLARLTGEPVVEDADAAAVRALAEEIGALDDGRGAAARRIVSDLAEVLRRRD